MEEGINTLITGAIIGSLATLVGGAALSVINFGLETFRENRRTKAEVYSLTGKYISATSVDSANWGERIAQEIHEMESNIKGKSAYELVAILGYLEAEIEKANQFPIQQKQEG